MILLLQSLNELTQGRSESWQRPGVLSNLQNVSPCNRRDRNAPCACRIVLVDTKIVRQGKEVDLEYPEAVCDTKENKRRLERGRIASMYKCTQLTSTTILYRDAKDEPIQEEEVSYNAGCELRHKLSTERNFQGITSRLHQALAEEHAVELM